jgi:hypothetical protein
MSDEKELWRGRQWKVTPTGMPIGLQPRYFAPGETPACPARAGAHLAGGIVIDQQREHLDTVQHWKFADVATRSGGPGRPHWRAAIAQTSGCGQYRLDAFTEKQLIRGRPKLEGPWRWPGTKRETLHLAAGEYVRR